MDEKRQLSESSDSMDEELVLPGFRFHPTEEELIGFYLKRINAGNQPLFTKTIKELDIYNYDPWDLPTHSTSGNREWYFSCNRNRKCRNNMDNIHNRTTRNGVWKATGFDEPIYCSRMPRVVIGLKKKFAFHQGHTAGISVQTDWFMDEFRLPEFCGQMPPIRCELNRLPHETDSWVICKISEQRGISHNYNSTLMYAHGSEPMQDRLDRRMVLHSSRHYHPYPDHTSDDSNLNRAANNGATEETSDDNQIKGRVEDIGETCIDIDAHPAFATGKIRHNDPINQSSTDFFYVLIAIILALLGQVAFTFIGLSSSSPTMNCVGASTVVGFIGSLSAMLLRYRLPKVARYLGKFSVVIGAAAVVAVYAARFHPEITWSWVLICGIALLIPSVAVLFA